MRTIPLILVTIAACSGASTPPPQHPGSRGLRASEHLDAARQDDEVARQQLVWPETRPDATGRPVVYPNAMIWYRSWDTSKDHERLAQIHRSKAAQLQAEYDEACAGREGTQIAVSPLARYALGGRQIANGVELYLSPDAGAPDKLLGDMKCHRAWMMLAPRADMDDCPLDLAGIHLEAKGDPSGVTVTITVANPRVVEELQRRAAHELETHAPAAVH